MATINGTNGGDNLKGTAAADRINGRGGDDVLSGGKGNDTLIGGDGADTLKGGAGNDLYFTAPTGDMIVDTGGFDTLVATDTGSGLPDGIEVLILRGDKIFPPVGAIDHASGFGNELDNTIRNERTGTRAVWLDGRGGDDVLFGNDGFDGFTFSSPSGDYGNDFVDGGAGRDIIVMGNLSGVVIDLRDGFARGGGTGGSGTVTFVNIEAAAGRGHNDRLIGDSGGNILYGGPGNDVLAGGGGNDLLGADVLINPDQSFQTSGHDRLSGGDGQDTLDGGHGNDRLNGGAGRDRLLAGSGDDQLVWDSADAAVNGGAGADVLKLARGNLDLRSVPDTRIVDIETIDMNGAGIIRLTLKAADLLAISSETDTLTVLGSGNDSVNIVGSFVDLGASDGFHRYKVGAGTLLVDTDITNVS